MWAGATSIEKMEQIKSLISLDQYEGGRDPTPIHW